MKKSTVDKLKTASEIRKKAEKYTKGDKCTICGKNCTSFCNSHSIPQFILKNIQEKGIVYTPRSSLEYVDEFQKELMKGEMGVAKAFTFQNICNECDNQVFQLIENKETLLNALTEEHYNLIALKILLYENYRKCYDANNVSTAMEHHGSDIGAPFVMSCTFDWIESCIEVSEYLDARKNKANIKHKVIWDEILEREVGFACNVEFIPKFNCFGTKMINDLNNPDKYADIFGSVYLVIYPIGERQTRIIMFYRRKYTQYDEIKREFDFMTLEEKKQNISSLLILYNESIAMNSKVQEKLKGFDEQLVLNTLMNYDSKQYIALKKELDSSINLFEIV